MATERIKYLLQQYAAGPGLTPAELSELKTILSPRHADREVLPVLEEMLEQFPGNETIRQQDWRAVIKSITSTDQMTIGIAQPAASVHRIHFLKTSWFRYAAAIIIIFGTAAYLWFRSGSLERPERSRRIAQAPERSRGNKAILTLTSGKKIELDNSTLGLPIQAGGIEVTTPRGGQYQLVLPDGTKVWLNAESSIKFPSTFEGAKERTITITGESYLEVAPDKTKPFFVKTNSTQIQVLGTSFNINSYKDELNEKTTLVEGSIKIIIPLDKGGRREAPGGFDAPTSGTLILRPGQQAQTTSTHIKRIDNINIDQTIAWKNGIFNFTNSTLAEVIAQLERWYDIEASYPPSLANTRFGGEMGRDLTLAQMLSLLEGPGLHFELTGRKLTVKP
jgi:ferric-dicitrate binding protein FerR (iron transport regulator)